MTRIATLIIIGALAAVPAAGAQPDRAADDRTENGRTKTWEVQVFASPGWNALRTSAEDGFALNLGPAAVSPTRISGSRLSSDFGWGAGARLSRGDWGVEAAYRRLRSQDLTPGHLLVDTGAYDGLLEAVTADDAGGSFTTPAAPDAGITDAAAPHANGNLFFGQVFRSVRLGRGTSLSIGLGGGYLRVRDEFTDDLVARDWGSLPLPDGLSDFFDIETGFQATRDSFVYGGSLALTKKMGRFLVRPRLDVMVPTRRFTTGFDYSMTITDDAARELAGEVTTSLRPVLFLASLEIGLRH